MRCRTAQAMTPPLAVDMCNTCAACYSHAQDDPDSACARCASSDAARAGGARRDESLRLPPRGAVAVGRAAHRRGAARAPRRLGARQRPRVAGSRSPARAGARVIVTDASVILELLLRTRVAEAIEVRVFDTGESL